MLNDEISGILEKLDLNLTALELRCSFCKKPHDFEKERELRLSAKEKTNEIKILKEKVRNEEDELLNDDGESKISKKLTDLKYEKRDTLHDIPPLESKLIKLGIQPTQIFNIKKSVLSS